MTSPRGSFAVVLTLDEAEVRRINSRLLQLPQKEAARAMRRGFGKWSRVAKRLVEANAPFGRSNATEMIRGQPRPNVHLKFAAGTRIKGYSRGLVVWAAVGIKEIRGSYLTPHWYLGWVERGHAIRRRATALEYEARVKRGETKKTAGKTTVGHVRPNPFIRRSAAQSLGLVAPLLEAEVAKEIARFNGG
jgi:hypothetical protein